MTLGVIAFILFSPFLALADKEFSTALAEAAIDEAGESGVRIFTKFLGYALWVGLIGAGLAYLFGGQQVGKGALIGTGIGMVIYLILKQVGY